MSKHILFTGIWELPFTLTSKLIEGCLFLPFGAIPNKRPKGLNNQPENKTI